MDKKEFPPYMAGIVLPEGAKEQPLTVYRICTSGQVDGDSFLPTYKEYERRGELEDLDLQDPGSYSVSCFEKEKDARNKLIFFTRKEPRAIAAKGITEPTCGPSQRTRERMGRKRARSHVDWWLYVDSEPWDFFEEVCLK